MILSNNLQVFINSNLQNEFQLLSKALAFIYKGKETNHLAKLHRKLESIPQMNACGLMKSMYHFYGKCQIITDM